MSYEKMDAVTTEKPRLQDEEEQILSTFSWACWPSGCLLWKKKSILFCPYLNQIVRVFLVNELDDVV